MLALALLIIAVVILVVVLSRYVAGSRGLIRVLPGKQSLDRCRVDDQVLISIPEEIILRGSLIAYLLPVMSMVAGAVAASHWLAGNQDVLAALGGVAGLAAGFALVRWHGARHRHDQRFQPVLVKILSAPLAGREPA